MSEVKNVAEKYVVDKYFPIKQWLNLPGQGLTYYDNVQIISSEILRSDAECATVSVTCTIQVTTDDKGEEAKHEEERTIEIYLEIEDDEWFVDNANE